MEYWHNLITEKSFEALQILKKKYQFILIGGWAVFIYTKALKSKDIDIIIEHEELQKMKQEFGVVKNSRLKKYEVKKGDFDIDIYLPYFSNPGLPAEEISKFTVSKDGFTLPAPEVLLIMKQCAFSQRKNTPKGEKDKIDIFSLLMLEEFDWLKYKKVIKQYDLKKLTKELKTLLNETFEIKELNLTRHKIARLKKDVLAKL